MADPYYSDSFMALYGGECRAVMAEMPAESVHCVVTSPPYWGLRDYGTDGQLGLEPTPEAYVANMVAVFREVRRVLRADGTLWLNLGDSYAGSGRGAWNVSDEVKDAAGVKEVYRPKVRPVGDSARDNAVTKGAGDDRVPPGCKPKDLVGIPWMVAFALRADGWYLRSDIIWSKPNPMPESVTDRPTKAHEYLFLLSKSARYFYDSDAVRLPGHTPQHRNIDSIQVHGEARPPGTNVHTGLHRASDKQRGHSRRHAGFNDRWDAMEKAEQVAGGANLRTVWTIATEPYPGAHFATFPRKLVEPCVKAGCPEGGTVLDPFAGSGTTLLVAQALGRKGIGIDLNPEYLEMAVRRGSREFGRGKVTDLSAKEPNEGLWALDG